MKIAEVIQLLEKLAPPSYQESYDNAGLLTGNADGNAQAFFVLWMQQKLSYLKQARRNCNLIVAHHPIIFGGLKKITGKIMLNQQ